ncbi:3-dehydroquinate synthase [Psychroflexus halocasei]|uniref:3-dehydroquinate synthase n=1 Tax=Psychroflexus halocasei TaxID=908615 RepID=A0A1H3Y667_9FLAO|nr:3-dehydroquinate synthase [Psychroflexus halocasei]SEA07073.1 3-dehydroquinate synthase [Psychroflexus halocasei]
MNLLQLKDYSIHFLNTGYQEVNKWISGRDFSKIFVLVDSNSHQHCLKLFLEEIETDLEIEIIEIEVGEAYKSIKTCNQLWQTLADLDADKASLVLNLGGGVVTDIGGFIASTFKRGLSFIHIPTTLLGMVDAAIGGKNGVNAGTLKNQIGVINTPEKVMIDPRFLSTLNQAEMRSGLAEMIKHGFIADQAYLDTFLDLSAFSVEKLTELIERSIEIKTEISENDPHEKGMRKALNFGHTLGHAIESYSIENDNFPKLLHGEAVAVGMILALNLSVQTQSFKKDMYEKYVKLIKTYFTKVEFSEKDISEVVKLLKHDKKNTKGRINFVLLSNIGQPVLDCEVNNEMIYKAFEAYKKA